MKKRLIVFEGLDGCGKTTQIELFEEYLKKTECDYTRIKLPDYQSQSSNLVQMYLNGDFGKNPEDVNAYAAGTFYAVDRYASYKNGWGKDYNDGKLILADRYATSNAIFQMEKVERNKWDEYLDWSDDFEYNKMGIPKPDLVIYLDMPIAVSQVLMTSRYNGDESKKDVHEANVAFLENCRKSALYAAEKQGWKIISCSDGEKPYSIEKIHEEIVRVFEQTIISEEKKQKIVYAFMNKGDYEGLSALYAATNDPETLQLIGEKEMVKKGDIVRNDNYFDMRIENLFTKYALD